MSQLEEFFSSFSAFQVRSHRIFDNDVPDMVVSSHADTVQHGVFSRPNDTIPSKITAVSCPTGILLG
jgi:hypothetical protein